MAYTKTNWTSTTTITTTLLNHAETQYDEIMSVYMGHNHDSVHYTEDNVNTIFWNVNNDGHGSGMDADLLYYSGGNKHYEDLVGGAVPSGIIIMWSGSTVPSGWYLCDGNNGTPNLLNKFVIGAGGTLSPGATGRPTPAGTQDYQIKPTASVTIGSYSLTLENIAHSHGYGDWTGTGSTLNYGSGSRATGNSSIERNTGSAGGNASGSADPHTHSATFTGSDCDVRPPYYKLAYIMKA